MSMCIWESVYEGLEKKWSIKKKMEDNIDVSANRKLRHSIS